MWHIIKYRLYNSNKKRKLDSAILQVSSNFLSLPLLTPYQSVVFHVHIGKRFQFRNELLDFFLGRLWQYNSPAGVSSYVHQLGAASSDKRHHSSRSNCIKGSAVTIVERPSLAISSIASTRSSILGALFIISR